MILGSAVPTTVWSSASSSTVSSSEVITAASAKPLTLRALPSIEDGGEVVGGVALAVASTFHPSNVCYLSSRRIPSGRVVGGMMPAWRVESRPPADGLRDGWRNLPLPFPYWERVGGGPITQ